MQYLDEFFVVFLKKNKQKNKIRGSRREYISTKILDWYKKLWRTSQWVMFVVATALPILALIFIAWFIYGKWFDASAADLNVDMLVYRGGGDTSIPEYRTHNDSGFGTESTAQDVTGAIEYVKVVADPIGGSDEKILCVKDGSNDVNCQVWNGTSWGNLFELSQNSGTAGSRTFDVAYEQVTGDVLVCYSDNSNATLPFCNIWNGTNWTTTANAASIGAEGGQNIATTRMIPDPNSDRIALMIKDTKNDLNIQIWNGTTWGNLIEVEASAGGCDSCFSFDGDWETISGDFVAAWFSDDDDELESRVYSTFTGWGTQQDGVITGLSTSDNVYVEVAANPETDNDHVLVVVADDDNTLTANRFENDVWETQVELDANLGASVNNSNHLFDLAYEHASDFDAIVTYGSVTNDIHYRVFDEGTDTWGAEQTFPVSNEDVDWHQLAFDPKSSKIMLTTVGTVNDVQTIEWNGNNWESNWTVHETASDDLRWNAWFTYDYENEVPVDIDPPVLSSWDLDMTSGTITLFFNEEMDTGLTPDLTTITLQNAAIGTTSTILTGGTFTWIDTDTIEITLNQSDFFDIQENIGLATSILNSYLRIAASSNFQDISGNELTAIVDGSAIQVINYVADTIAPNLARFDVNMNTGVVRLYFDEPISTSSIADTTRFYFQDAAVSSTFYQFTGGGMRTRVSSTVIDITLSQSDLNGIKLNTGIATSLSNTWGAIYSGNGVLDNAGNEVNEIPDGSALQATVFVADITSPILGHWDFDTDLGLIALSFSEPVSTTTLDVTQITLQDAQIATSPSTTYTLTGGSFTTSSNAVEIFITLSSTDLAAILANVDLATSADNSYITITANTIDDMAGNPVVAINDGNAMQVSTYGPHTTFIQSAYRFFENDDSTDVGAPLAIQDTPVTLAADGDVFRLRMLLHLNGSDFVTSSESFKLQYASRVGTCDTGFVGESYFDITPISDIAFFNNPTPADGDALTNNANDPQHNADSSSDQDYEESNPFTNSEETISVGTDGKWDFSLRDNNGSGINTYCFRAIKANGAILSSYAVIPEITTALGNAAPVATVPATIIQQTNGSGYISFKTTISDADANTTTLKVEYSDDGGATFYDAQLVSVSSTIGTVDINNSAEFQVGDGDAIDTNLANVTLTILWDTQSALNGNGSVTGTQSDIQLRVTPTDGTATGTPQTSGNFSVDNEDPIVTALAVSPSSSYSGVGDVVVLLITATESGLGEEDSIFVNGVTTINFTDIGGGSYSADYVISEGDMSVATGTITASVVLWDAFGNTSTEFTIINTNTLAIDANTPTILATAVAPSSGIVGIGDTVTVTLTNGETGLTSASCEINNVQVSSTFSDNLDNTYSFTYTLAEGDGDWATSSLPIDCQLQDIVNVTSTFAFTDSNTLRGDTTRPVINELYVSPDTGTVGVGDTVILFVSTTEAGLSNYFVLLNAVTTTNFQDLGAGLYSVDYVVQEGDSDVLAGAITAYAQLKDGANNTSTPFTTVNANTLAIDANTPTINTTSVSPSSGTVGVGDLVTVTLNAGEVGLTSNFCQINGVSTTASFVDNANNTYSFTYTVLEGNADWSAGNLPINCTLQDAGNNTVSTTAFTDGNTLAGDANTPTISSTSVSPSSGTVGVGDLVTVTLNAGEIGLNSDFCQINGVSSTASFVDNGNNTYSFTYTVAEGNTDWSAGNLPISCNLKDVGNNTASTTAFTDGNTLAGDANTPVINATGVSPNSGFVKVGDMVTVTITSTETGLITNICQINGVSVTSTFVDNTDNTYTLIYTLVEGDADWTTSSLSISCNLTDAGDNNATTTAFTDGNTLAGDANTPVIVSTSLDPSSGTITYGATVTTTIIAGEAGLSVGTCTINGTDVSGSFVDNMDNTYTLLYTFNSPDPDWAAGALPISCELLDVATNTTTTIAYDDANTLAGDATPPQILATGVFPYSGIVKVGDTVTATVTTTETGLVSNFCEINSVSVSSTFVDNNDNTYNFTYIVQEGNTDWSAGNLTINCVFTDAVDNTSSTVAFDDGNTLAGDANTPTVSALSVSPNSGTAGVGDTITLTITASEAGLTPGTIYLNGSTTTNFQDLGAGSYSVDYTVQEGDNDVLSGAITSTVSLVDVAGNTSTPFTTVTANTLAIDANTPVITLTSVFPSTGIAKVGDTLSIVLAAGETGLMSNSCLINSVSTTASFIDNANNTYTFTYTVTEGDSDWVTSSLPIICTLTDAGNNTVTTSAFTDGNTLSGDANSPVIAATGVNPSFGFAMVGDTITVTITSTETGLSSNYCAINNVSTTASIIDNGNNSYSFTYTVTEGDSDWATSSLPIICNLLDYAGNVSTSSAFTDSNTLAGDANSPVILSTTLNPNSGILTPTTTVTTTITATEIGLSVGICTINGEDVSGTFVDNNDNTYTITYTFGFGDTDWGPGSLPISCALLDVAGNTATTTAFTDGNTLAADANAPTINAVGVSPYSGTVMVGDTVTVTVTSSETGLDSGSCLINSVQVSSTIIDNADTSYTFTYTVAEGNSDWSAGNLMINCLLTDVGGNTTTASSFTDGNTLAGDANSPTVSALSVSPNSGTAGIGDTITLTITGSEAGLSEGIIYLNGSTTTNFQDLGAGLYSVQYTILEGDNDVFSGAITSTASLVDAAGNSSTPFTTVTANTLAIDANTPNITLTSVFPSTGIANVVDTLSIVLAAGETGLSSNSCLINSVSTTASFVDNANNTYTFTYTLTEGDADWATSSLPIVCTLTDAGNNIVTTTAFTDGNTLSGDANSPVITSLAVSPNSGIQGIGDTVLLLINAGETGLQAGSIIVNGKSTSNFTDLGAGNYSAQYVIASGDTDVAAGNITASAIVVDVAGNTSTVFTTVTTNTLAIDANAPVILSTALDPNAGIINATTTVTTTITVGETGLSVGSCTINGEDVSGTFVDNNDNTYTVLYTFGFGDSDWGPGTLSISCTLLDAGNNSVTTSAYTDGNTLAGDGSLPMLSAVGVSPYTGISGIGDTITVTVTATETGLVSNTCLINNVQVSSTLIDNANNSYNFTYIISEGDADWSAGALPVSCSFSDLSSNIVTTTIFTDGNTLVGDANAPNITSVVVSPSTGTAQPGNLITITLTAGETGLTVQTCTVNGKNVAPSFIDNSNNTYTITYTPSQNDTNFTAGNMPISCTLLDAAQNTDTATSFTDGNTLAGNFGTVTPPVTPPSSGGGGGGGFFVLLPSKLSFFGIAYPSALVTLYDATNKLMETIANNQGEFTFDLPNPKIGSYDFSIHANDPLDRRSSPYVLPLTLGAGSRSISNIYLAPTIALNVLQVAQGDSFYVTGMSVPGADVSVRIINDGKIVQNFSVIADSTGVYALRISTITLAKDTYLVETIAMKEMRQSNTSIRIPLTIGDSTIMLEDKLCDIQADVNGDCEVNLVDFSILAFWYLKNTGNIDPAADLNGDGVVNLVDISILIFYYRQQ